MNRARRAAVWLGGQWANARAALELNDVFWIGGLAAVGYGLAQIYVPAAWIVCGSVIFWLGVRR